jgi:hypothetical protein
VIVVVVEMMKNKKKGPAVGGRAIKCDFCSKRISIGYQLNSGILLVCRSCYFAAIAL